ncbi:MAG: sensor histidine kinase [Lachnospiraceae bacterium]
MRDFVYTIQGKVLFFITNILAALIVCICIIGAAFMSEYHFYDGTKEKVLQSNIETQIRLEVEKEVLRQIRIKKDFAEIFKDSTLEETNLRYAMYDSEGKLLTQNEKLDLKKGDKKWEYYLYCYKYHYTYEDGGEISDFVFISKEHLQELIEDGNVKKSDVYEICAYLKTGEGIKDIYFFLPKIVNSLYGVRYTIYLVGAFAFLVMMASFVALMYSAGRRKGTREIITTIFHRIPWDILIILVCIICFSIVLLGECTVLILLENGDTVFGPKLLNQLPALKMTIAWIIVYAILIGSVCLSFFMSTAARMKKKNLLKNTVICRILRWIKRRKLWGRIANLGKRGWQMIAHSVEYIPLMGKTIIILVVISLLEFFVFVIATSSYNPELYMFFWILEKLVLVPAILYIIWILKNLQKAGIELAAGNMDYQVDIEKMFWDFKQHGENLNNIAQGMNLAVLEKMKSEHLKTELITNVSHDIKTPLTSIINYTDLISKEKCENKTIIEYTDVLLRQSKRLKRLIEDLIEASKASTGNLDVELAPCEAQIFLSQVFGEYEEKLKEKNLKLVTNQPENSLFVMADGRRMYRIFDNLMTNICKYAQSGTRVYISLEEKEGNAVIVFKNISHAELNLSPDELMERFVRGDISRNTEGNGLGLSIARNLAKLQNGSLDLEIDGDLFKAILCFPIIKVG